MTLISTILRPVYDRHVPLNIFILNLGIAVGDADRLDCQIES